MTTRNRQPESNPALIATYGSARSLAMAFALAALLPVAGCKSAPSAPSDQALTHSVQSRLSADSAIASEPIQASAASGIVTLNGSVSNAAARALASDDAARVQGVRTVVNNLTVQPAAAAEPPAASAQVVAPSPEHLRTEGHSEKLDRHKPLPSASQDRMQQKTPQQASNNSSDGSEPLQPSANSLSTQPPAPIVRPGQAALAPPAPTIRTITLPSGTTLAVRMNQTLDSATAQPDDVFKGMLASDIVVDGILVLPQGTPVLGRVVTVQEAAHFKGDSLLTLTLTQIDRNAGPLRVATDTFSKAGNGRGKNTVEKVGGGAAIGALLGGLFGGGKGAAIGALAGGGTGAGVNAVTRGQQVQIPTESVVRFSLAKDLAVPVRANGSQQPATPTLQRHPAASSAPADPNANR